VVFWSSSVLTDDGYCFYGLCFTLGTNEFLGCYCDYKSFFRAIPVVGPSIVDWLWGGFCVDNATLNRFFSLHFVTPFLIAGMVIVHIALLHKNGSNNPLGVESSSDKISFYPYFYVKDLFSLMVFVAFFSIILFYFLIL